MQRERRHNPYPFTWEIPLGIVCLGVLTLAVGVHLGHGLAQLAAGHGWGWPPAAALFTGVPGVLAAAAGPELVWVLVVELLLVAVVTCGVVVGWRRWGPGRLKGMASREEAARVLGVGRLRRVAPVVRPDLYAGRRTAGGGR